MQYNGVCVGHVSGNQVKSQINGSNTSLFNCTTAVKYCAIAILSLLLCFVAIASAEEATNATPSISEITSHIFLKLIGVIAIILWLPLFAVFFALRDKHKWEDYPLAMPTGSVRALLAILASIVGYYFGQRSEGAESRQGKRCRFAEFEAEVSDSLENLEESAGARIEDRKAPENGKKMNGKKLRDICLTTTISVILVFVMFTAVASAAPPEITSFAPPSPVYDDTCALRTFNVTLDQTVNVNWYLDDSLLFTDVSVTEAKCSLKTYVTGEHNVSAIATNQNGTDMQTWIWNVAGGGGCKAEIHRYLYRDEEAYIDEIHRTVEGYAHYDLGPSFYSNDWDIWHVGSWSDLTAGEIAYLDTVTGLSAGIWYYIDLLNQTVATTPFENYSEEIGREVTEEIIYEDLDPYTVLFTHIITTTVTIKDHIYQLIVKVEDVTTGAPNITSFAPPSPVSDDQCSWRTFNVTVNQMVNVSWYLDDSLLFTNVSVTEANCSLRTYVRGVHNVSVIATNPNGTDMQTWIWNVEPTGLKEIHRYWYRDEEEHIEEIHRTVAGYAHDDLGPSFYSNDWDIWHVGSWSDLTADEIAYLDTVTGLSANIWYYIDLTNQTVSTTPFQDYSEEVGTEVTEEIVYECLDPHTVLFTHIITTTVTYKDHIYQLIVKVEDVTTGAPNITSFAPPSPVNDTVCNWRTFNVTINQTANVSWHLNNTLQHTNVSTKEANYSLHAEVVGEHNVSAIASNENGTDMQTWVWNVTAAPVLNCTCGDICVNETGWWRDGGAFIPSGTPIQDAIDNATAGDIICVKDGTYNENVDVTKSHLTIRSENGPSDTTVSASLYPDDHVFNISDQTNVTLEGFEIRDAHGTSQSVAGIYMYNASECKISDNIVTNISATGQFENAYGIWLSSSSDNSFDTSTVYNLSSANDAACIWLGSSSGNSFDTSTVYNLDANDEALGIGLYSSSGNSFVTSTVYNLSANAAACIWLRSSSGNSFVTSTVYNLSASRAYGIYMSSSSDNSFVTSTVYNLDANDEALGILLRSSSDNNSFDTSTVYNLSAKYAYGILLISSSDNSFDTSTVYNLSSANDDAYGIYLRSSSDNNSFSSGSISDVNAPTWWDFYSAEDAHGNSAEDITISSFPTTISFTYDNGIMLKSVATPPADPAGKRNISKYVNVTEVTAESWIFMNVSYEEGDLGGVDENSLRLWRHNGTDWTEVPGTNGVNTAENYVYANITEFSVFAPLGNVTGAKLEINKTGVPDPVSPGGTLNYTISVNNTGNATATNVTVKETYDGNMTFVMAVPAPSPGNNTWKFATLNVSETRWINISVTVNASVLNGTVLHNIVNVTCDEGVMDSDTADTTVLFKELNCTCGDICVNTTGWWRDGGAFNTSSTPIQAAIDNATAGDVICVKDGTYTENVDVYKRLTIRSENGAASTSVRAASSYAYVFEVTADYVNISGFHVTDATYYASGIYLCGANYCNISDNNANENSHHGIFLNSSNDNTLVNNNANSNNESGIYLYLDSNNNYLINNTASENKGDGFKLESNSNRNRIIGNNASDNDNNGIRLYGTTGNPSSHNTVANNTADLNDKSGIMIEGADSDHNTIVNNTCKLNDYGISVRYGDYNNLTKNTCNQNSVYGIRLYQSADNNEITNNTAISNTEYGIYISSSDYNIIYNNYFNNTHNANDNGNNVWNTTKTLGTNIIGGPYLGGNYWSDYAGIDINGDGLGDTLLPHNSSGGITNDGDYHPLAHVGYGPVLSIEKSDNPDPVLAGGRLNYTIHVNNTGNATATNVTVMETYDKNVTFVTAVPAPSPGDNTWKFQTLNVSETRWINISVTVNASVLNGTVLHNIVNVTCAEGVTDTDTENTTVFVAPVPVLEITKTDAPDPVSPGGTLNYTIAVNNTGNATATNVIVMETYDENVTFIAAEPAPSPSDDTWQFPTLNVSETRWINVSVIVNASVPNGTVLHNIVNVTCDKGVMDSDTENTTVFIAPALPPNITSFAPPSPVNDTVCNWRTFNVTVDQTVNVSWYLNNTLQHTNVSTKEANYTLHAEVVGEHNVSAIASNGNGMDMQTWVWNVTAAPEPVLEITKTDVPDPVSPGGALNYTIHVNNAGNATAINVIVKETYDANVTFVAAEPAPSSGDDTWQFPTLNVSETRWINVSVNVNASVLNGTVLHNVVNVTCDEGVMDSDTENTTVFVAPVPVLEINKTDAPDPVLAGGTLNYSISVNNVGNATATNVMVMETYDKNVTFVAAVPVPSSGDDTWQFPTLNASETRWINISVTVNVSVPNGTVLHNIVTVSCDEGVTDSDTEDTTVFAVPVCVETATDTGIACFATDSGTIEDLVAVDESTLPEEGKPELVFPHGFFSFNITGLTQGRTVVVTLTLPDNVPVGTQYWKYHAAEGGWIRIQMGSDDGDNVITITLVDGGLGDDDGIANGVIVDQGGPGIPGAPPVITSFAPPSPVNDTVCNWRTFNVTVDQTVNVSWYLNNTLQHTNVSTKEANYSLHAEVVGEHNVSAIASNANGTDMQSWVWNVTAAPEPVLEINKTDNPDPVSPGGILNYTIRVNNTGNATAINVIVKETYDANVTFIAAEPAASSGDDTWQFATLNVSETRWINISVTVNSSVPNGTVLHNIVNVTCDEGVTGSDTEDTTVFVAPALPPNITSFAPPSPVNDTVCNWRTFNVTVDQTVNVSWYLNNTLQHTNVSTKEASYTLHAEVVGEHNVSAIATNGNGTDMQSWVWNVTAAPLPVLEITKTGVPDPVSPGGTLDYTIHVNNTGNAMAINVIVKETYDANVTFIAAEPAASSGDDTWQFATLNASETRWINISVTVNSSVPNGIVLHNIVNVTCDEGVTGSDTENTTVFVAPVPVLEITKTDAPDPVSPGGTLNYTISVNNTGNGNATNVTVMETYDENVTFVAAEPAPSSGDDMWQFPTLNASETRWINISVIVNAPVLNGTVLHNIVNVSCAEGVSDTDTENTTVFVAPVPVLEIAKTDAPDPVSPGGSLNYTISVNNTGNGNATNVTVIETYDKNVTFVAAVPAPSSGDDTWQFPTLNASEMRWINISVIVNASVLNGTVLHNIVNVSCAEGVTDTDTENTTVFAIPSIANVKLSKWVKYKTEPESEYRKEIEDARVCNNVSFKIAVQNNGTGTNLTGISVTDVLNCSLGYINGSANIPPTTYENHCPDNQTLLWQFATLWLEPGKYINITFDAHVDECGNDRNYARVDAISGTGCNVSDEDYVYVNCTQAIKPKLTKSTPTSVAPGGTITYTILYANVGPVALTDVMLTENYPEGVTFISAVPAPDAGTNNKWTRGTLPAGSSGQIIIKVKVPDSRDLSFTESGSVTGEGLVMVSKDLSTEQKPYRLKNVVTITCAETEPVTASASTTVSGVPGTSLEITEHGSGIYESEEILNFGTKNKSIRLQKSTEAEYMPTSFYFSDGFSVVFTNMWMQDICSKNMVMGDAMHKKIKYATYIKDDTKTETGEYGTELEFASSFHGAAHIGAVSKDVTTSEDYIGEFEIFWAAKEECQYLFNWSRVPGNDSEKLIRFLVDNLAIKWAENATITKSNDDRVINISTDWHSAEVILAANNETATVKVGDEIIYVLDVRTEDGTLNVYDCRLRKISESVTGEGYVMVDKELTTSHIQVVEHGSGIYSSDTDFDSQRLNKSTEAEYQPTTFNFSDSFGVNFSSNWMQGICSKDKKAGTAIHKKISDATSIADDTTATKSSMAFETSFNGSIHVGARTKGTRISEDYIGRFNVSQVIKIGDATSTSTSNTSNSSDMPYCP